eukprot:TRINITY_DN24854_c0_g1_i1.p1 TRINITY_DN24854_c0_g1~~TRINITY_DN24854_c0_g1_i1.p1  ORF type:complete len:1136 (+),score=522.08 TRINITY_DN24854_c0_g1_i1:114-3521(+)
MAAMGDVADMEAELIKRNREIMKVRDEVLKVEKRLEESQMRNDDLLEKVSELDAEVTKKTSRITELEEKVKELTNELESHGSVNEEVQKKHMAELDALQNSMKEQQEEWEKEREGFAGLHTKISDLESLHEKVQAELEEEKRRHTTTKFSVEQLETSSRDHATRAVELRKQIKELEDTLDEERSKANSIDVTLLAQRDEERMKLLSELHDLTAQVEEHKGAHEDLADLAKDHEKRHSELQSQMDDIRREADEHLRTADALQAANDELQRKHDEQKATLDNSLKAERKRGEERYEKAASHAAALDGKMSGQRLMIEMMQETIDKSEAEEQRLADELAAKVAELQQAESSATEALQRARDEASKDTDGLKATLMSELASEEVCARRSARAEIDEHLRSLEEAEFKHKSIEAQLNAAKADHEDALAHHEHLQESLKGQQSDLRERLVETEEKLLSHEEEVDRLKKALEEASNESERAKMAHRLEVERMQQSLEAEAQSRSSAEQISASKLEEKDTLLDHAKAHADKLEQELEDQKRKVAEHEAKVAQTSVAGDQAAHQLNVRIASLEGELKARQARLTEVEGRLDAQRQYLEQLQETLGETQMDKEKLMQTKSSLEQQLQLESTHKEAVNESLLLSQEESSKRIQELEEQLRKDREAHQDTMDEVKHRLESDVKQLTERSTSMEQELTSSRQRCEQLVKTKADLQQELAGHRERHATYEAKMQAQKAEAERLGLELDQNKQGKAALEEDVSKLKQEKQERDTRISELLEKSREAEAQRSVQLEDFTSKVKRLDQLLETERENRATAEAALAAAKQDHSGASLQFEAERKRKELELVRQLDDLRAKFDEQQMENDRLQERIESLRSQLEGTDVQRRETEANLRGENATSEARLRRLEAEAQRANASVEEGKAILAQTQAGHLSKLTELQRDLEKHKRSATDAEAARESAEKEVQKTADNRREMMERLAMSAEELAQNKAEFMLQRQKLSGSLEESRRTLRASLGAPNPAFATADAARLQAVEQQLTEERRKAIQNTVALQRAERKLAQLEDSSKRAEDARSDAVTRARDAERRCTTATQELDKFKRQGTTDSAKANENREQAQMAIAEMATIRYESKYEVMRLRGALDELRKMMRPSKK